MANDGYPLPSPETKPSIMALLTGAASLATGALLYGAGASQAATLAPPANDGSRWALSNPGAAAPAWSNQAAWKDQANTFSAAQVISAAAGITVRQAVTQDAVALIGRAGGTSSYVASITPATLSGNRTITIPDATGTLALLGLAQTWTGAQTFDALTTHSQTSGTSIRLGRVDGASSAIDSSLGNLIRHQRYGYSTSYTAVQIGDSARGVGFGVDPNTVAGGQFSGDARDVFFRRGSKVLIPNAGATDWETLLYLESGSNTLSAPIVTIATAGLTVAGITTTTTASVIGTTASTSPSTGAHVVAGGVGIGGGMNVAGASGIGGATNANVILNVGATNPLSGTTQIGVSSALVGTTAAGTLIGVYANPGLAAGTWTCAAASGMQVAALTVPVNVTVTTGAGVDVLTPSVSGTLTNYYAYRGRVASGTGRYNLYCDGTAANYLNGQVLIGTATDGMTAGGSLAIAQDLAHRGTKAGFFNTAPATKPTVTGSRGGNAALASLLTSLAGLGLLTDSSSA